MSKPTNTMTIQGDGYQVSIVPEAIQHRDALLAAGAKYKAVTSTDEQVKVQNGIKALADLRNMCEKHRKEAKAPIINAGNNLDKQAKDFVSPIEAEEKRLAGLVIEFLRAENEKARKAREEAERIERERKEAELKAEREKLAAERAAFEAEQAAARASNPAELKAAEAAAQAAEAAQQAATAKVEAIAAAPVAAPIVHGGLSRGVSEVPDFEVTDIWEFAAAFQDLCNPPTPKRAEILAKLEKTLAVKSIYDIKIPGLRVYMATKVRGVR